MRKYHHIGIPTTASREGEAYLEELKLYYTSHEANPYGVEWLRFDPDCALPDLVMTVPHVAFEVDDLDAALEGKNVIIAPNSPSNGVRVAFIEHEGAPIEFLEYSE